MRPEEYIWRSPSRLERAASRVFNTIASALIFLTHA